MKSITKSSVFFRDTEMPGRRAKSPQQQVHTCRSDKHFLQPVHQRLGGSVSKVTRNPVLWQRSIKA
jgi:hypothetical protein